MSWSELCLVTRRCAILSLALLVAGCGFRPLYLDNAAAPAGAPAKDASIGRELASVSIQLGTSREAILLRNNLIFALTGGGDETATPLYRLDYSLVKSAAPFTVEAGSGRQSAAYVTIQVSYFLIRLADNETVFRGRAIGRASFDKPTQRFAAIRAERDGEDRAVGDASDAIRNALAAYFVQKTRPQT